MPERRSQSRKKILPLEWPPELNGRVASFRLAGNLLSGNTGPRFSVGNNRPADDYRPSPNPGMAADPNVWKDNGPCSHNRSIPDNDATEDDLSPMAQVTQNDGLSSNVYVLADFEEPGI